jgi:hypothetical protein
MGLLSEKVLLLISASDKPNCRFALRLLLCGLGKIIFQRHPLQSSIDGGQVFSGERHFSSAAFKTYEIFEKRNVMKLLQWFTLSFGLLMLSLTTTSPTIAQGPGTEMTQIIGS